MNTMKRYDEGQLAKTGEVGDSTRDTTHQRGAGRMPTSSSRADRVIA